MAKSALESATIAADQIPIHPTSLVSYQSSGKLLIIGRLQSCVESLPALVGLDVTILLSEPFTESHRQTITNSGAQIIEGTSPFSLTGFLGSFELLLPGQNGKHQFDLVLDLNIDPSIRYEIPPVGYYPTMGNDEKRVSALEKLPEMTGIFDKPKYFSLDYGQCAHSRRNLTGCGQCIQACATSAIESVNGQIIINPYLCQGCGDCATVCPSGAIHYVYPSRLDTLNRLRTMLKTWFNCNGPPPVLVFHDLEDFDSSFRENLLPYRLEALGSAGIDIWLSVLAYGAVQVWLFDNERLTHTTRENLMHQIEVANALLKGLGYTENLICLAATPETLSKPASFTVPAADYAGDEDKRTVIRMALDHLYAHAPQKPSTIPLPENAPFGEILVNGKACTLCMSCVSICPGEALQAGQTQPQLKLIESNCVQCGLCRTACPEQAIMLYPRYIINHSQSLKPRMLHEEAAFHCIKCNKPFATESMIKALYEKLKNHPMFQGQRSRMLMMCEQCKVESMFDKIQ